MHGQQEGRRLLLPLQGVAGVAHMMLTQAACTASRQMCGGQQALTLPAQLSCHGSSGACQVGVVQGVQQPVLRLGRKHLGEEVDSQVRGAAAVAHTLQDRAPEAPGHCLRLHSMPAYLVLPHRNCQVQV